MSIKPDVAVGGIVPMTTIDYPGHISSVIFFQGCLWRCKYCHNKHLQTVAEKEALPWDDVFSLIKDRKAFIEAVVFSGGEPLVQPGLLDAIRAVKELDLKVALHTGGSLPLALSKAVSFVDWVGFDIKHSFKDYSLITGVEGSGDFALESLKILLKAGVPFEARMTVDPSIDTSSIIDVLKDISAMGVRNVALQKCRDQHNNVLEHEIFEKDVLLGEVAQYFDNFYIRN